MSNLYGVWQNDTYLEKTMNEKNGLIALCTDT